MNYDQREQLADLTSDKEEEIINKKIFSDEISEEVKKEIEEN